MRGGGSARRTCHVSNITGIWGSATPFQRSGSTDLSTGQSAPGQRGGRKCGSAHPSVCAAGGPSRFFFSSIYHVWLGLPLDDGLIDDDLLHVTQRRQVVHHIEQRRL